VRKGEPLAAAKQRVAQEELGAPEAMAQSWLARGEPMGAWDHFYNDSAFSANAPTHYVNLPFWVALSWSEAVALAGALPVGAQHSEWRWVLPGSTEVEVHAHVKPYLAWVAA
jgi:colanic acid biosynthesis protein WcaH